MCSVLSRLLIKSHNLGGHWDANSTCPKCPMHLGQRACNLITIRHCLHSWKHSCLTLSCNLITVRLAQCLHSWKHSCLTPPCKAEQYQQSNTGPLMRLHAATERYHVACSRRWCWWYDISYHHCHGQSLNGCACFQNGCVQGRHGLRLREH